MRQLSAHRYRVHRLRVNVNARHRSTTKTTVTCKLEQWGASRDFWGTVYSLWKPYSVLLFCALTQISVLHNPHAHIQHNLGFSHVVLLIDTHCTHSTVISAQFCFIIEFSVWKSGSSLKTIFISVLNEMCWINDRTAIWGQVTLQHWEIVEGELPRPGNRWIKPCSFNGFYVRGQREDFQWSQVCLAQVALDV